VAQEGQPAQAKLAKVVLGEMVETVAMAEMVEMACPV
jgi:hypothetical protein